jgi:DNA processing protein
MARNAGLEGWLRLTLTPGLGAAAARSLLKQYGLPENVFAQSRARLQRFAPPSVLDALESDEVSRQIARALEWATQPGHWIVTLADKTYPRLLLEIPDPPTLLYAHGRIELVQRSALAVVGSRNATPQGERDAETFSRAFSDKGLTIVSGLAMGIDAAAHRGGLGGRGSTIAVLGTGIDVLYPARNKELAGRIAREGLLLSEFPLGCGPLAQNFPRRNRLISGLARGCLVVEAALASGSLITARSAAEQGREVFAIPGSIHSPISKGCHALIKSGAKLVESADDVLAELAGYELAQERPSAEPRTAPDPHDEPLLALMGFDPIDVDSLAARSGLPAERVTSELLRLELGGQVAALPGGLYQQLGNT